MESARLLLGHVGSKLALLVCPNETRALSITIIIMSRSKVLATIDSITLAQGVPPLLNAFTPPSQVESGLTGNTLGRLRGSLRGCMLGPAVHVITTIAFAIWIAISFLPGDPALHVLPTGGMALGQFCSGFLSAMLTSAATLIRQVAQDVVFPHSFAIPPMKPPTPPTSTPWLTLILKYYYNFSIAMS